MSRRRRRPAVPDALPISAFPTANEIAARAHEMFVGGGRRLVDIPDYWRAAEQELLDQAARRVIPPATHGRRS